MRRSFLQLGLAALISATLTACGGGSSSHDSAQLRAVHASPDAPKVDVVVNKKKLAEASYGEATGFNSVDPGNATININVNGSNPTVTALAAQAALERNKYYTVLAANKAASIEALTVVDENNTPASGSAKLRVVHAAPDAPEVDVYVTAPSVDIGATLAVPALSFAFKGIVPANGTRALEVPGGDYRIRVTPKGSKTPVVYDSGTVNVASGADLVIAAIQENNVASVAPISLLLLPKSGAAVNVADARAKVRVGHYSPNTPTVDVYLSAPGSPLTSATEVVSNASFPIASSFLTVQPGRYRASAALDNTTAEAIGLDANVTNGLDISVFAIGLNGETGNKALRLNAYPDDLRAPATGKAKLRVLHLSPDAPAVDVVVLSAPGTIAARVVQNLAFPNASASYLELDPGNYTVAVVPTGQNAPILPTNAGVTISLAAGNIRTAAAIGCLAVSGTCSTGQPFSLTLLNDN
jgi:Domain of unknown function (DUF4397)